MKVRHTLFRDSFHRQTGPSAPFGIGDVRAAFSTMFDFRRLAQVHALHTAHMNRVKWAHATEYCATKAIQ